MHVLLFLGMLVHVSWFDTHICVCLAIGCMGKSCRLIGMLVQVSLFCRHGCACLAVPVER